MRELERYSEMTFEEIKRVNEYGQEFWSARELSHVLDYTEWRNFLQVIQKAMQACKSIDNQAFHHFVDVNKMVELGSGAQREIHDIHLSRYACYLIVMNGDPRKEVIALGQTYFAVKARQQELIENYDELQEDQRRIAIRAEMREHNKSLVETAKAAGVIEPIDYAVFQNAGYKGLYGGLDNKQIHAKKNLKKSQKILDHMGSTELAINLFRATQAEEKLKRDKTQGKQAANQAHYTVGEAVRKTIGELGGTMPEDLPTPDKSIKQIERAQEKKKIQ